MPVLAPPWKYAPQSWILSYSIKNNDLTIVNSLARMLLRPRRFLRRRSGSRCKDSNWPKIRHDVLYSKIQLRLRRRYVQCIFAILHRSLRAGALLVTPSFIDVALIRCIPMSGALDPGACGFY